MDYFALTVKGFSQKFSKNAEDDLDWYDKRLSFDLEGNSNGIDFTAYDKQGALEKKNNIDSERIKAAKGILRIEVKLTKQKSIKKYTEESSTVKQIRELSKNSKNIFLETFVKIVPYGDFFRKKEAIEIVKDNITKKSTVKKLSDL